MSWSVRRLEPSAINYKWSAMLAPDELGDGVAISDVRSEERFDRRVVAFARAVPGDEPVRSCCLLVFSEVSPPGAECTLSRHREAARSEYEHDLAEDRLGGDPLHGLRWTEASACMFMPHPSIRGGRVDPV